MAPIAKAWTLADAKAHFRGKLSEVVLKAP